MNGKTHLIQTNNGVKAIASPVPYFRDLVIAYEKVPVLESEILDEREEKKYNIKKRLMAEALYDSVIEDKIILKRERDKFETDFLQEQIDHGLSKDKYKWFFGGGFAISFILTNLIWLMVIF